MSRGPSLVTVTIAIALALAGCGSSTSPSKEHYIARADSICVRATGATDNLVNQVQKDATSLGLGKTTAGPRLASELRQLQVTANHYLHQLESLPQPSGGHAAIEKFLGPLATVVSALGKAATSVARGQLPAALALLEKTAPVAQQADDSAASYGISKCETLLSAIT